jgi:hypothetical protein
MVQRGNEFPQCQIAIATHNNKIKRINRDQLRHALKTHKNRLIPNSQQKIPVVQKATEKKSADLTKACYGLSGGGGKGRYSTFPTLMDFARLERGLIPLIEFFRRISDVKRYPKNLPVLLA